jgi:putative transposase
VRSATGLLRNYLKSLDLTEKETVTDDPNDHGEPRMASKNKAKRKTLETIWRVPNELWSKVEVVLDDRDAPSGNGRPRIDQRAALDGIIYVLRTGCQWGALPEEFGDDASVHRTMQRWMSKGVFEAIWALLVHDCDELGGVDFEWQSADGAMGKARKGGTRLARIPRIVRRTARNAA